MTIKPASFGICSSASARCKQSSQKLLHCSTHM